MKATNLLLGLVPWVLFSILAEWVGADGVALAAGVACLGSLILAFRGARADGLKVIDAAGVLTFGALTATGLVAGHAVRQNVVDYGRGGSAAVLALVMFVSAFTVPFTLQYARAQIDPRYWGSPVFRQVNAKISLAWAGLIAVVAAAHLTSGALTAHGSDRPIVTIALNWGVPILVVIQGLKITKRISTHSIATVRSAA